MKYVYLHPTYAAAVAAVESAMIDVIADHGHDVAEQAQSDVVRIVCDDCPPLVARELANAYGVSL